MTQYGMSDKFGLIGLASREDQYLSGRTVLNCSDETAAEIDKEVMMILKEAYQEAKAMLQENRDALDAIAAFLIEKETITGKEFMKILREIKGIPELEEEQAHPELKEKTEELKETEESVNQTEEQETNVPD